MQDAITAREIVVDSARPVVTPEDYGASGLGIDDNTAHLEAAIAALQPGDHFLLAGTYRHATALTIDTANVLVSGDGTLIGTDETNRALRVTAPDVVVEDITLDHDGNTDRQTPDVTAGLYVGAVAGFRGRRITIKNAASVGVILRGSTDFLVEDFTVVDSWADGIHMTGGANTGRVVRPTVLRPGDDGVAVVSYLSDDEPCHDIDVFVPKVHGQNFGRGLSVVGGTDIRYWMIDVAQTDGAGVYIACEDNLSWQTYPPVRVKVIGGTISGANFGSPIPDHAAVHVINQSDTLTLEDVEVSGLTIRDTYAIYRTIAFIGGGGGYTGCSLKGIFISGRTPRIIIESSGGTLTEENIRVGVTQFVPHPSETWVTDPNTRLSGAQGSTAVLLNGSYWMKTTADGTSGWMLLGTA